MGDMNYRDLSALIILGGIAAFALYLLPACESDVTRATVFQIVNTIASGLVGYLGGRGAMNKGGS
jgi:hypothetical protein